MNPVRLDKFDNGWFSPGRSLATQLLWFFFGAPIVRSHWLPSSSIRVRILKLFGARMGRGVVIKPGVRVKFPWKLTIGSHSWIGEDAWIDNLAQVEIGNHVCVSQAAYFCTGNHNWSDPNFGLITNGIRLNDGSWAGARCLLAPGVTLGECAVAAAGSVVLQDIPAHEVHSGNPAAFIKRRDVAESQAHEATPLKARETHMQILDEIKISR